MVYFRSYNGSYIWFSGYCILFLLHLFEDLFLFHLIGISYPRPIGEGGNPIIFTFHPGNYYLIPVSMSIGGLLSGLIVYTFAPEAEGHGTDAAIKAYHYYQGKMR